MSTPSSASGSRPCASIEEVHRRWGTLKYMRIEQARFLRDFIKTHDLRDLLELGFFQGKSTAFMAAVLEQLRRGHIVAMDSIKAKRRDPSIEVVLRELGLNHRVTPVYAYRSFTWELQRLLAESATPRFDFCYIDGAHTWDGTGFSFFLVDLLLKPGGWIIFDDLEWTMASSESGRRNRKLYASYSDEEQKAKQVRLVWELLVPTRGYDTAYEEPRFGWGIARKRS